MNGRSDCLLDHEMTDCPPAPGSAGSWRVELQDGGAVARYVDSAGVLLGFALTGRACARKSQLLKEMPPVILENL